MFHQQMKNFCEKHQHRQWWAVFVDLWSLTIFKTFSEQTKGWIFVFLPWGGPQVGNQPLAAACGSTSAEVCCCCSSSSKSPSTLLASEPDSRSVSATRISLMASSWSLIFLAAISDPLQSSALFRLLSMTRHSCRNLMPQRYELLLLWQQTDLKVQCGSYIKFQLFEDAQDVFSRLTVVRCMLLPHNPYRGPQYYKRHICGQSCSSKYWLLWISPNFWALVLSELYGHSTPLNIFLVNN